MVWLVQAMLLWLVQLLLIWLVQLSLIVLVYLLLFWSAQLLLVWFVFWFVFLLELCGWLQQRRQIIGSSDICRIST